MSLPKRVDRTRRKPFAIDARTNSVIVSGSEKELAMVEAVLLRLDAMPQANLCVQCQEKQEKASNNARG